MGKKSSNESMIQQKLPIAATCPLLFHPEGGGFVKPISGRHPLFVYFWELESKLRAVFKAGEDDIE